MKDEKNTRTIPVTVGGEEYTLMTSFQNKGRQAQFTLCSRTNTPVTFTVSDGNVKKLAEFLLVDRASQTNNNGPDYSITDYRLKVVKNGEEVASFSKLNPQGGLNSFSYENLKSMVSSFSTDESLVFILYPHARAFNDKTVEKIIDACIERQKEFINTGDRSEFRFLRLRDVEQDTGYDISTISRICRGACVYTNGLKVVFNKVDMSEGAFLIFDSSEFDGASSTSIAEMIEKIIDEEDPRNPYADDDISDYLKTQGYDVARRTIAKYRSILNIPNSNRRRRK